MYMKAHISFTCVFVIIYITLLIIYIWTLAHKYGLGIGIPTEEGGEEEEGKEVRTEEESERRESEE